MFKILDDKLWMGTETSLQVALRADEAATTLQASGHVFDNRSDDDQYVPRLVEVHEGVAHISISGPLVNNNDSGWNEYFGLTGYPEIREAMVYAATNPEVSHILLNIESGGGSVSGVADTGKLIRMVNDKVKPVTAFTDGAMYSAAYWLGSSAGEVYAGKAAGVGSIGVIATHMERSEMLKSYGIGVTVVRAGKFKALANGVEKLSEEGKAQIQAGVDAAYKIFVDHVADMRGKSYEFTDTVMAQGREFFGQAAADAGLVDAIKSSDEVLTEIQAKLMDTSKNFMDNRAKQASGLRVESNGDAVMAKKNLTEQDIAALAAGAQQEAGTSTTVEDDVQADTGADASAANEVSVKEPLQASQEDATSATTIKFMSEQLKTAQDELIQAKVAMARLEDKNNELLAAVGPLKEIAAKATNNMRVALRGSAIDMSSSTPAQVVAEYASVLSSFTKQFPVGGVAAVDAAQSDQTKADVSPLHRARVAAVL